MKKFLAILLCFIMLISTTCFAAGFSDLTSEHWAYKNVTNLVENGVINGYPDGTYRPEKTITRGEFFKLIMTVSEEKNSLKFLAWWLRNGLIHICIMLKMKGL